MGNFPKLEQAEPKAPKKGPVKVKNPPPDEPAQTHQHDINYVAGLGDVASKLDWIGDAVASLIADGNHVGLAICQNRYGGPIQLTATDEDGNGMMDRLVTAVERIADSLAKVAGLTRPRLESWHEQSEYTPRYRDGGLPGPPVKVDTQQPSG